MFDTPVLPRLAELLAEVQDGTIQIPAFQRDYVWSDEQRLRLMDSIWRGIPIGSLLVWRTTADKGITTITRIGPSRLPEASTGKVRGYLVDGLQRVTTLYSALMPLPEGVDEDEEGRRWPIYYELDPKPGDDLRFRLRHRGQEPPPTWMPLSCLLNDELFFKFRTQLVDMGLKHLLQEARRVESRFRDYVVPVVPLISEDPSLVAEAFTRVNSLGQKMDEGDMAHALTLGVSFNFNAELSTIQEQLSGHGWERLERRTLLNTLKAIWNLDIYKSGAKGIQKKLESPEDRAVLYRLPELFAPIANLLQGFGVYGPGSLPYSYQLVALVRLVHAFDARAERLLDSTTIDRLRRWFFWTTYGEHFTGMTSRQLRDEFVRVEELAREVRDLDWVPPPRVAPLGKFRATAVRSRAAVLVMARAGDRHGHGDRQQRLYGRLGMDALHSIFPSMSAEDLSNRVLAEGDDLKRLRAWMGDGRPLLAEDQDLLARNLLAFEVSALQRDPEETLRARRVSLELEERAFVEELDATWELAQSADRGPG